MSARNGRLRLQRADGRIYLDRFGIQHKHLGGILLHRMDAPDPGIDLHDHPWWFGSLILWGGYTEERGDVRRSVDVARLDESRSMGGRGTPVRRRWLSWRTMRLDECHRITALNGRRSWSLIVHAPVKRGWGFYTPTGWVYHRDYDVTRRDGLHAPVSPPTSHDPDAQ